MAKTYREFKLHPRKEYIIGFRLIKDHVGVDTWRAFRSMVQEFARKVRLPKEFKQLKREEVRLLVEEEDIELLSRLERFLGVRKTLLFEFMVREWIGNLYDLNQIRDTILRDDPDAAAPKVRRAPVHRGSEGMDIR